MFKYNVQKNIFKKRKTTPGMARAFILAGAQAVLTTLWRVPDESAAVFMKFFYQYMMDGFKASHSLQKAMLSIRSFHRYSKYIHWSGYQLTGREVEFQVTKETAKIGPCPVFPRLEVVNKLEKVLVKNRFFPTDVQVRIPCNEVEIFHLTATVVKE